MYKIGRDVCYGPIYALDAKHTVMVRYELNIGVCSRSQCDLHLRQNWEFLLQRNREYRARDCSLRHINSREGLTSDLGLLVNSSAHNFDVIVVNSLLFFVAV